ncbi:deoxyribose-phosphate aldolase [Runella slithyformis]|uniref:Deoxyribose-phosphate aldolase n=1 Tax=Runella slithyformis (strain ATCC 29530 / DSM 19594 / LMG 11500 / NCIMB 11436 / LSU 4) TaxID=761193 RepID=A0A7U3ZGP7_RUNSL|nr:deoxyribose-phosphate aldolase [Runella slithyformis]AEI46825.1 Deoxyribose-phosphate aldolase [Runella slithyformis DSM 19594]
MFTLRELAKMIDHSLLQPSMTDADLLAGCELARLYSTATVCIKPYAVGMAKTVLEGSGVGVCTVVGFPHGGSTISLKVAEARQACKDGATEIDMVVNIGKVLSEDWRYVKKEIYAILKECHKHGAILKVIFENDLLPKDKYKIKLCKICSTLGVEFVKTSTGYGYTKQPDGSYNYKGATTADLILMRKHCAPEVQVKAAGGIRTLEELLKVRELGVTRIGATATVAILEEAKKRLGIEADTAAAPVSTSDGY